jgi:hypothetical protein
LGFWARVLHDFGCGDLRRPKDNKKKHLFKKYGSVKYITATVPYADRKDFNVDLFFDETK